MKAQPAATPRRRSKTTSGAMIFRVLATVVLLPGMILLAWLVPSFLSILLEPWPPVFAAVGMLAGTIGFIILSGSVFKYLKRVSVAAVWLGVTATGLLVAISPLLALAVRGSWEAEFLVPSCNTCSGPAAWLPLSDYASIALVLGAALAAIGAVGWLRSASKSRREARGSHA